MSQQDDMETETSVPSFDEERASAYDDRIRRLAPGYDVLHRSLASLLSTMLGPDAHLLIVGAGTGAEIIKLGHAQPGWRFTAVDPSPEMLDRCRRNVREAGLEDRVEYVGARVENLPGDRVFDAATSVFVAHFIHDRAAKRRFFQAIADQLSPGAPFVLADLYKNGSDAEFSRLMAAWREELSRTGASAEEIEHTFARVERQISFVEEAELERILEEAGFTSLMRFHQCLLWGAWWTRKS